LEYIQVEGIKVIESETTPFAQLLIEKGITRYPSPYIKSRGEELKPLEETVGYKRKDENTVTEYTILNPESIPLALSKETQELMQTIFKYYLSNRTKT
jgi:predicted mannosyl-3-phosphoglycerate phosphatase (HAD superfamily)